MCIIRQESADRPSVTGHTVRLTLLCTCCLVHQAREVTSLSAKAERRVSRPSLNVARGGWAASWQGMRPSRRSNGPVHGPGTRSVPGSRGAKTPLGRPRRGRDPIYALPSIGSRRSLPGGFCPTAWRLPLAGRLGPAPSPCGGCVGAAETPPLFGGLGYRGLCT